MGLASAMRWNHLKQLSGHLGDAAEAPQEALDLVVSTVSRLDVQGPPRTRAPASETSRASGATTSTGARLHTVCAEPRQGATASARSAMMRTGACPHDRPRLCALPRDTAPSSVHRHSKTVPKPQPIHPPVLHVQGKSVTSPAACPRIEN